LIVCIPLSINAIRGILKYTKFKAEQTEVTAGKHFSKYDLLARFIEFLFFVVFGLLAQIFSKP
jgi:hypothetical protein